MKSIITILLLALSVSAFSQSKEWDIKLTKENLHKFNGSFAYGLGVSKKLYTHKKFSIGAGTEFLYKNSKVYNETIGTSTITAPQKNIYKVPVYAVFRQDYKYHFFYANLGYMFGGDEAVKSEYSKENDSSFFTENRYTSNKGALIDVGIGGKYKINNKAKVFISISSRYYFSRQHGNAISIVGIYKNEQYQTGFTIKNFFMLSAGLSF